MDILILSTILLVLVGFILILLAILKLFGGGWFIFLLGLLDPSSMVADYPRFQKDAPAVKHWGARLFWIAVIVFGVVMIVSGFNIHQ